MLDYLRNAADKVWAKVLMFILIFSFVGWGAAEWILGITASDNTVISVGNSDISVQQLNNERSRQLYSMSKEEQRSIYTNPNKSAEFMQNIVKGLTMNQLLLNRAFDMGFVVSDKKIADEIRQYPDFKLNGVFSPLAYTKILAMSGISEKSFVSTVRSDILRQMMLNPMVQNVKSPEFMVDAVYNARYTKRDIQYKQIKFADIKIENPTDEQLKIFYTQNPKVLPEARTVSYVFLASDNTKPDSYDAGLKKAQVLEDMIISGESLKNSAEKNKAKFVTLNNVSRNGKIKDNILSEDLLTKVFSMETGLESELLELKNGFVILRVDEIIPEHNADFADVKKELISDWKKSEQRKKAYVKANEILVDLNKNNKFDGVKTLSVSRTEGAVLPVLNASFANNIGQNTIVEDSDAFYVLHIEKESLPKIDSKRKESVSKELQNLTKNSVLDDFSQFLKRHYPVKIKEKVFNKFFAK